MTPKKRRADVMVGSTYRDLSAHRRATMEAVHRSGLHPTGMEFDSAKPGSDVLASSFAHVDAADVYVLILSFRYGGVPACPERNPDERSITELEYRRALERGIPVAVFVMSEDHPLKARDVEPELELRKKLDELREEVLEHSAPSVAARFDSVESLREQVLQTLHELELEPEPDPGGAAGSPASPELTAAPELCAVPPFVPGRAFVGRDRELLMLDDWAGSGDSLMLFDAIGGMGKSMVTWHWVESRARAARPDLAGILWYSFYERGADMADFAAYAVAYTTGTPLRELLGKKAGQLADRLATALAERPWLLVLDGLERVLVAYNRVDAPQLRDEDVELGDSSDRLGRDPRECIRESDADVLRLLAGLSPSRILVTSRLMPTALVNEGGEPLAGVRHERLDGLDPADAEQLLRNASITGDGEHMRRYLERHFGCHPLVVGVISGLVRNYRLAPRDFDRWVDDPAGGAEPRLEEMNLAKRRGHVLSTAFKALTEKQCVFLGRLGIVAEAADFATVEALSPFEPSEALEAALTDLERRGLLHWDRIENSYDLHPVVRSYAFERLSLEAEALRAAGVTVEDHFSSRLSLDSSRVRSLEDLANERQVFRARVYAGKFEKAWTIYDHSLHSALSFDLERYDVAHELLRPLFEDGDVGGTPKLDSPVHQVGLLSRMSWSLRSLGFIDEAVQGLERSLEICHEFGSSAVRVALNNLCHSYVAQGRLARAMRGTLLALRVAEHAGQQQLAKAWLRVAYIKTRGGYLGEAEEAWRKFDELSRPKSRNLYRPGQGERYLGELRLRQGRLDGALLDEAHELAQTAHSRKEVRKLHQLRGELHMADGEFERAARAFARAGDLAREAELPVVDVDARCALALTRCGRREDAERIVHRIEQRRRVTGYDAVFIAESLLALGRDEDALACARRGYAWAWADGPEWSFAWELGRVRSVFEALGEAPTELAASDPANVAPLPCEAEILAQVEELDRKQRAQE